MSITIHCDRCAEVIHTVGNTIVDRSSAYSGWKKVEPNYDFCSDQCFLTWVVETIAPALTMELAERGYIMDSETEQVA